MTAEGYFINLDFRHDERIANAFSLENQRQAKNQEIQELLGKVNATIQLMEGKSIPIFTEHIEFNGWVNYYILLFDQRLKLM